MKHIPFAIKAYFVALLTLVIGALMSVYLQDWSWLSRMGALIVINGIILTSHQIIDHIQQLKVHQTPLASQFKRDWAEQDKQHFIQHKYSDIWIYEKHGLYMLIAGTFIWGFGDLLNYV